MLAVRDMRMSDTVEWAAALLHRARRLAARPGAAGRPAGRVPRRAPRVPGQGAAGPDGGGDHRVSSRAARWVPTGSTARRGHPARDRARGRRCRHGVPVPRDPSARSGRRGLAPCLPPALRHRSRDVAGRGRMARRAGGHDRRRPDHRAHRRPSPRPSCSGARSGSSRSRSRGGAEHEDLPGRRHWGRRHARAACARGGRATTSPPSPAPTPRPSWSGRWGATR